jgi:phage baseplate assembly protein W
MPVERVSKGFKDISMSFQVNPLNYDLIAVKNETAIARSVRNLVLTVPGERFFNQDLGSRINNLLFENMDQITASLLRDEVANTIRLYEPRVAGTRVEVIPNYDTGEYNVVVRYNIVGIDALPQQLSFALQPVR